MQKHKLIFFILLIAVIIGGGTYKYLYFRNISSQEKNTAETSPTSIKAKNISSVVEEISSSSSEIWEIKPAQTTQTAKKIESELSEYRNAVRGFSLRYPAELSFKEYDEGNESYSIVFEDKDGKKSFQIFFTPYFGNEITQSRILKDVPSGKFTEPVEIVIGGGIHALTFLSENDLGLGQMREVWFLHDDYLYEVTTYADLDTWLFEIMKTWIFDF